ncbi:MAG TPA: cysteine--tRNA ligase [Planctomycetaceae bacterium]|nr:cysteine--tRNA ligase [Planctomycetaceae bacterium]
MTSQKPNIRIYNTLTRQKEDFQTVQPGKVGMYLCGPTVYAEAHIGHMVGPVIFDTIKRYLVYCGYEVTWVVNITDVDDKLIAASQKRGIPMSQVATEMTMDYMSNLQALGVTQIDHMPRATENMDEIITFISELIQKGFAYESDGDVFFDVTADSDYGQLSNRSVDSQQGEGGGAAAKKRSPGDFALWKSAKNANEPAWDSPWGQGRPGWHIECSAMSRRILGETFDIHGGGLDLMFPHHENELAQSRCCHAKPMVRYWMHNGLMRAGDAAGKVGGKSDREQKDQSAANADEAAAGKISRSKGAGGLAKLIKEQTGDRIRFFLLSSQYRSTIVYGTEALEEAGQSLATFYRLIQRYERLTDESFYKRGDEELAYAKNRGDGDTALQNATGLLKDVAQHRDEFLAKMDDDFNTGAATSELFEICRRINRFIDAEKLEEASGRTEGNLDTLRRSMSVLRELGAILGVFIKEPETVESGRDGEVLDGLMNVLIELRAAARAKKDFETSDTIRDGLGAVGITLQDLKEGTTWEKT